MIKGNSRAERREKLITNIRHDVSEQLDEHHDIIRQLAGDAEAQGPVGHVECEEDDGEDNSAVLVYIRASHSHH